MTPSSSSADSGNVEHLEGVDHLEGVRGDGVILTLGVHEQHQLRAAKELRARYSLDRKLPKALVLQYHCPII